MNKTFLCLLVMVAGCATNPNSANLYKATILGLRIAPGGSAPSSPKLELGLARSEHISVPHGITLTSHVTGSLGFNNQNAVEDIAIGPLLLVTLTNSPSAKP